MRRLILSGLVAAIAAILVPGLVLADTFVVASGEGRISWDRNLAFDDHGVRGVVNCTWTLVEDEESNLFFSAKGDDGDIVPPPEILARLKEEWAKEKYFVGKTADGKNVCSSWQPCPGPGLGLRFMSFLAFGIGEEEDGNPVVEVDRIHPPAHDLLFDFFRTEGPIRFVFTRVVWEND